MAARDVVLLLTLSAVWGSSFTFIKVAVEAFTPLELTVLRLTLAALVLAPFLKHGDGPPARHRRGALLFWGGAAAVALFGNALPFTLIGWGEQSLTSASASVLIGLMPVFALLFSHFLSRDERLNMARTGGVLLGLSGLVILSVPYGYRAAADAGMEPVASLAVAAAAACYAFAAVVARRLLTRYSARRVLATSTVLAAFLAAGALGVAAPASMAQAAAKLGDAPAMALTAALTLGLLNTAAAGLIFFVLLRNAGVVFTSLSNYLIPLFGIVWGAAFLHERLTARSWLALAVILAGVALIRRKAPTPARL